jgi:hypothetical protein
MTIKEQGIQRRFDSMMVKQKALWLRKNQKDWWKGEKQKRLSLPKSLFMGSHRYQKALFRSDLIIEAQRRGMEMEETTKVREKLEKMQRGDHRFRKVVSVPENSNFDGIKAKFKDETLLITLPLLHISDQQNREAVTANGKTDQSVQSKVERSSPAGQEDSMKEPSGVAHDDQRARHPEAIRQYDGKAKGAVAAEESKGLVEGRKTEAPKLAQEFVHGEPPISKGSVQERSDYRSARYPEMIQPADHKAKPIASAGESKELVEGKKVEAPKHAQDFVGGAPISKESTQGRSAVAQGEQRARYPEAIRPDDVKSKLNAAAEESKQLLGGIKAELPRHAQAFVGGPPISKDPMQEISAIPQGGQSARHPEAIRPDDDKSKTNAAAKESKEFLGGKIVEVPKQARDFVGVGPKIAKEAMQELSAVAQKAQSTIRPEVIQPDDDKSKPNAAAKESKEFLGGKIAEVPKHARDLVAAGAQIAKEAMQELSAVAQKAQSTIRPQVIQPDDDKSKPKRPQVIQPDDDKSKPNAAAKESKEFLGGKIAEAPKHARDFVGAGAQIAKKIMKFMKFSCCRNNF